ncbi:peptidylprolyl isomerase [Roseovarius salinarum]|uniref:peptidylprolyl isomerase n=1 Tax=Roseovarius salinarum TaxID=1981892 RepID=UPI000C3239AB|nr:peptidylprolyl isomerase [Roseovarius salinarum]
MASGKISKTLVWILMGLLILGLGGFGVTNLSGRVQTIGSVGETEITVQEYARALRNEIRALEAERGGSVTFAEAREAGVDQRVLSQLIATAALDEEARRLGISVGDENLREQLLSIPNFQGPDGEFDREAYRFALDQAGMTEAEFEADIRAETARSLLQGALVSGVRVPQAFTGLLIDYLGTRRDVAWLRLGPSALETEPPAPTEADLKEYHAANEDRFTEPEKRRITYAWLTPEMMADEVEVSEDALRDAYEARIEEFQRPERRLVERLAFETMEAARAAREKLDAGEASFESLVEARGLELSDIDLGDVTRDDLGPAAEAVFDAGAGAVAGPVQSNVGPALFRVNGVLQAQETSFEDARAELRAELAADRARRLIDNRVQAIDDMLAAGATLEELAEETPMRTGRIDWHEGMREGIAAYAAFREAAAAASPDDYPELENLRDGGVFALRLEEVIPPRVQPLSEVRDAVRRGWSAQATREALRDQVEDEIARLETGAALSDLGAEPAREAGLTRRDFVPGAPPQFTDRIFSVGEGEVATMDDGDGIIVARVEAVRGPDPDSPDLDELRSRLRDQASGSLAQDYYQAVARDIRSRAGIQIDQAALNAVHANFQ